MKYLIDTHVFIWALMDTKKLSQKVREILEDENNEVYVSPVSFWEMAIKVQNGKLQFNGINALQMPHIAEQFDFTVLPPDSYDYISVCTVPQKENHHDPFDRMLIHQAIRNNLVLLSADEKFRQYEQQGLQLLW